MQKASEIDIPGVGIISMPALEGVPLSSQFPDMHMSREQLVLAVENLRAAVSDLQARVETLERRRR